MSQVGEILELLKAQIRKKGLTYKDLSSKLGVSESTLKRWFSQGSFNIERLDDLCQVLKADLSELLRNSDRQHRVLYLNVDQELELAANKNLFMVFYLAIDGNSYQQISQKLKISETETRGYLIRLDQIGLIELHPSERIVALVNKSVRWLADGPLNQKYGKLIRHDFMDSTFEGDLEKLWLETGFVTRASLEVFSRKFDQLLADFRELINLDEKSNAPDKVNITFVAAHRPWVLPVFANDKDD